MINLTIDNQVCVAQEGTTLLAAAAANGIYIPALCSHPDLPPFHDLPRAALVFRGPARFADQPPAADVSPDLEGCGLCLVEVAGQSEPIRACRTKVTAGLSITTTGKALEDARRANLMKIMARHPHACVTCAQREGCNLETCSSNVPKEERCCSKFHNCELRKVAEYVGIKEETPRYRPAGVPILRDEPLIARDFNLCIDCARCVRACDQVRGVAALGIVHRENRLVVGSVGPTLLESACKFCGACVEVCPTGCLLDRDPRPGAREDWLVPCRHTCPAGVDVPAYIRAIAAGDFKRGAALVWERLPLANVLGHICFHQCEGECRRGQLDDPLAICALKRFVIETGDGTLLEQTLTIPESRKKVAVVGGGPAGLAAAYFLRFKGHAVTVFEAAESPGGMPLRSIPEYRLPREVVKKDLAAIQQLGVEVRTGSSLSAGPAMADLLCQGFDAVLIAVGLPEAKKIPLAGSELAGVHWGLDFLLAVKAGRSFDLGREIVVVGGGNVALDVAMTALRLSGGTVRLFCLESRTEMPAHANEIAKAEAEGIQINPGWGPAVIRDERGAVSSVEFRRCVRVFDDQRKFSPVFDEQERVTISADSLILAIGQAATKDIPLEENGVFLAGDIAGGQMSVVHAVASGRAAAERIDKFLGGDGDVSVRLGSYPLPNPRIGREEGFVPRSRVPFPCASAAERRADFRQIEGTYSVEAAVAEAQRCLQCDLRLTIAPPALPPERWLAFSRASVELVPVVEGVAVLADADKKPIRIKGVADVQAYLRSELSSQTEARFFLWEQERMYTKRESELIQHHVQKYGQLPGGGMDELDELF
jgi:NADPH-dependent glutamate synthase beta subunit-like oxidoreductase/Pyruvate/2-oxoacid:ferredoxin oxidoreductase delta subunit